MPCGGSAIDYAAGRRLPQANPECRMTAAIAKRFPTPAIDNLPDDIRTRILAVQEKSGFVPNVFLTLAYRPGRISRLLCLS